jgi:putative lipoic acid-binding regulatory protein
VDANVFMFGTISMNCHVINSTVRMIAEKGMDCRWTGAELSKGRQTPIQAKTTVFGPDQMSWKEVDDAVNEYPCERVFTAIGEGSKDFKETMVAAVEQAINCTVHPEAVVVRPSKKGRYFSVRIGPVVVADAAEVVAVYSKMKEDSRMKWFL